MKKEVIVAARKTDSAAYGVQKYSNKAEWNIQGGIAPTGVSATRYLRNTAPNITQLSPLAAFLVTHCPRCVAGNFPAFNSEHRVRCYNGKSEADMLRENATKPDKPGRYTVNGRHFSNQQAAIEEAEALISAYGLGDKKARIDDWHFEIIDPRQTDAEYWNQEARRMLSAGVTRVVIGEAEFTVEGQ